MATNKQTEKDILAGAMARVADEHRQGDDGETTQAPVATVKKKATAPKTKAKPVEVKPAMVTYIPLEDGDMPFTIWHRIKFKANVPVEVSNSELIESARTNPWFSVDGAPPPKRAKPLPPRDTSEDRASVPPPKKSQEIEIGEEVTENVD